MKQLIRRCTLDGKPSSTIDNVKGLIVQIPSVLNFQGTLLEDRRTLLDYNIESGATFHIEV